MTWKCPNCGIQNTPKESLCVGCSRSRHPALTLQSQTTGERLVFRIGTTVGQALFNKLKDADARFASERQFVLAYDEASAAWMVAPAAEAKNPTFLNGLLLANSQPLTTGNTLSIGPSHHKMTVTVGE